MGVKYSEKGAFFAKTRQKNTGYPAALARKDHSLIDSTKVTKVFALQHICCNATLMPKNLNISYFLILYKLRVFSTA
ncbi:MAG: hypothetical protein CMF31_00235 [Kordiimonas sp.]|nr:hypothetical protein [Kordiimonas sp.]|tara:strand:- start:1772 stop:2002 length:231 start_codon:yes stop_codon:yes gene_type:complete